MGSPPAEPVRDLKMDSAERLGEGGLDPEVIMVWFRSLATLPTEQAAKMVSLADIRAIPHDKLLKLRDIKVVRKHPELNGRLQRRSSLP